ncbi:hypothetical protein BC008_02000 [Mastigocoleus testarum BC008]|uniref:Uncharacterized protein n=1 Tax=Mastigocoleus testarum BC008 TaxID=371196 RepID=A0A0V7ZVY1_9CYAN|nr:hypothetical protein BC008_02000 [Mastigocoleus testarum BC008]
MTTRKGKKRIKNQPILHEELKKMRGVYLTESSWLGAKEKAIRSGLSASEYIEQLIRKDLDCTSSGEATP